MRLIVSSLALRQAILTTAVAGGAIIGFGIGTIAIVEHRGRVELQRMIDGDIAGLGDIMASGGATELARRIADRTDFVATESAPAFYRLERADGTAIAGSLVALPTIDARRSEARDVDLKGTPLLVRATQFRGGLRLLVARSLAPANALVARLWWILGATALATLAASLAIGLAAASRVAGRVATLNATFARFDRGDMAARTGISGRDELDQLAGHIDTHLARIENLFRAQRQISDNIAHEMRTPLVYLDARLLALLDSNPGDAVAAQLAQARGDIRSVVAMFDALLDIALAESGGRDGAVRAIDLSQLANDVADLYAASAEEVGIAFSTRIASDVTMRGEVMQMTRLIANLLDNALKYVPPGGRVQLSLAAGPRLVVEDNGPGVPVADRARIFERFQRSAATGSGHGLGLALVSVIAARHGLVATVEDAAPGARFVIAPAVA